LGKGLDIEHENLHKWGGAGPLYGRKGKIRICDETGGDASKSFNCYPNMLETELLAPFVMRGA